MKQGQDLQLGQWIGARCGGSLQLAVASVLPSLGFGKLVRAPELGGKRDDSGAVGGLRVDGYVQEVLGPGRGTWVCRRWQQSCWETEAPCGKVAEAGMKVETLLASAAQHWPWPAHTQVE